MGMCLAQDLPAWALVLPALPPRALVLPAPPPPGPQPPSLLVFCVYGFVPRGAQLICPCWGTGLCPGAPSRQGAPEDPCRYPRHPAPGPTARRHPLRPICQAETGGPAEIRLRGLQGSGGRGAPPTCSGQVTGGGITLFPHCSLPACPGTCPAPNPGARARSRY